MAFRMSAPRRKPPSSITGNAGSRAVTTSRRIRRRHRAIELAAAMIGQDDAVRADVACGQRIVHAEDALDDQIAFPLRTNLREMRPVEVIARGEVAQHMRGQDRRAARRERIFEVRHPVPEQCPGKRADQPARPRQSVPRETHARTQRRGEAGTDVVLAIRRNGNVDGHDERPVSRTRDALEQRGDAFGIARKISLKPGGRRCRRDRFERDQRRAAHDRCDACRLRGAGEHDVAAIGRQRVDAHRRDTERRGEPLPEQVDRLRAGRHVAQHARREAEFVEHAAVVVARAIVFGGAAHVAEDRTR